MTAGWSNGEDSQLRTTQQTPPPSPYGYDWPPADDEISLFDLWDALVRRRWLIAGVAAVVTLAALAYALLQPDVYRYQTSLRIGETVVASGTTTKDDGTRSVSLERKPIANAEAVVGELESSLVPRALRQVLGLTRDELANGAASVPDIQVESPSDSGIVHIRTEGAVAKGDTYREILRTAAGLLVRDHASAIETEQLRLENRLERLGQEKSRLSTQLDRTEVRIDQLATGDRADSSAVALRIDGLQERAAELQQRILELESERNQLQESLATIEKNVDLYDAELTEDAIAKQNRASSELAAMSGGIRPTTVISAPQRSLTQTGTSGTLILALGIVLGGMLGVFAAFVAEFLQAAKRRRENALE